MRTLLLFTALSVAVAQTFTYDSVQIAERTVEIPGHYYVVRYEYGTGLATIPATTNAQVHYEATILVFEVINGKKKQIGHSFSGQYTDKGCWEDRPEDNIKYALELEKRLTPEIRKLFDEREQKAAFDKLPQLQRGLNRRHD